MSRKGTSMSASLVTGCSGLFMMAVGERRARQEQTTNTLPPLYRQINREDRLVVREGVCVLGRKGRRRLSYLHTHLPP